MKIQAIVNPADIDNPSGRPMRKNRVFRLTLPALFLAGMVLLGFSTLSASAATVQSAFATVHYANRGSLQEFNNKLGCTIPRGTCLGNIALPEASTGLLISALVEHVHQLLDLETHRLHFHIHLLPGTKEVQNAYADLYGDDVDYIAFYSPRTKTIYLAVDQLKLNVFAHEITHAIVDRYFDKQPPVKIHEMLAQYVEKQL